MKKTYMIAISTLGTTNETNGNLSRRRNDVWEDEEDYDY